MVFQIFCHVVQRFFAGNYSSDAYRWVRCLSIIRIIDIIYRILRQFINNNVGGSG